MKTRICLTAVVCLLAAVLYAQSLTSLNGLITDATGAVVPGATLELQNVATQARRVSTADATGHYSFPQIPPGNYEMTVKAQGFSVKIVNDLQLLVNTPATVNVSLEVGAVTETLSVMAEAVQVNTSDASIGNAVAGAVITQLPFEARNVVGLLSLQPGVVFLGEPDPGTLNDYRSGAVNGGKSDQANVMLDGVDVNDQENRGAFSSVLRVTLDSVQEFRTITTNSGADFGRTSGAQVTLVTKSGTNTIHGSAYEYLRNTATSANSFFNNAAGVPRQKLNRNVFGGAVGGPIRPNRLFYFFNYEGRRDRSDASGLRIVPTDNFRQGMFKYIRKDGSIGVLTPDQIKDIDPAQIGPSPEALQYFQQYPLPNDTTVGDGLNTAGFRFNASTPLRFNTYIAKFDYALDSSSRHQIFWRGNLQNDNYQNGIPQFPGQPASSVFLENSKGYAVGYTGVLLPALVSTFRYGYTRQGVETTGVQNVPVSYFRAMDSLYPQTRGLARIIPVHNLSEDVSWTKGSHAVSFGGVVRFIANNRATNQNSFSRAYGNAYWLAGTGGQFLVPDAANSNVYKLQFSNILGLLPLLNRRANYDLAGNILPEGALVKRKFAEREYEMYAQDSWKVTRGLTITAGLRYSLNPPVYEARGYQISPNVPLGDWFNMRGGLAGQGKPQSLAPKISFDLSNKPGGRDLYPYHKKNFAPRLAIAYSPQGSSGLSKFLFGGPGKSSIRAGWGMFYDLFGQGLIRQYDSTALGFSTSINNPANANAATVPRFTGFFNVPLDKLPAAPPGGFPQTYPDVQAITNGIDDTLKAPYTMNMNFSIGREFKGGFFVQGSYVGRQSRRSLISDDIAMPTNLKDPKSGQTYFEAAKILSQNVFANTPVEDVKPIPFWENLWPAAAGDGLTATQGVYSQYLDTGGDFTTALYNLDVDPCSPCSIFGPFAMFNSQYSSLYSLRSRGNGNYHAMQWTIRKRFSQGYQFDFNYTWSKSIDLASTRETDGVFNGPIINAWFPGQNKAVSDYDTTHIFSALALLELPFGRNKKFLTNANRLADAILGGWQISGVFRNTSGFPAGVNDGAGWATNWEFESYATQTGVVPAPHRTKNAPSAQPGTPGGANIFANPQAAFNAYSFTAAGETGQRNGIRGDGYFGVDLGIGKRFLLFTLKDQPHTIQFRAEGFNVTNTVRFDVLSAGLDAADQAKFGQYSQTLTRPRVFQFSLRYQF